MGVPIPNIKNEMKGSGPGPVIEYKLSPEELTKLRSEQTKPPTNQNGEELKKPVGVPTKNKYPHITKEFLEKEFAAGKSATQVEKEQGMPRGTIGYYMKKFGVKSQYAPVAKRKETDTDTDSTDHPHTPTREEIEDIFSSNPVNEGKFEQLGQQIGALVDEKNAAYGDSFAKCGEFLKLLYPNGIKPEQYTDALCLVRIFDKQMRIATSKDAFGESPYRDIAGYGLLGLANDHQAG